MVKKQEKLKCWEPQIEDGIELGGILAAGGLAGQAGSALSDMERNPGAGLSALLQLVMGALANLETKQRMSDFLFELWKTTEDEQATEEDLDIRGRLKARFRKLEPGEDPGWMTRDELLDRSTPYYRKLKRYKQLPMGAALSLAKALSETENFADFLELAKTFIPTDTTEPPTPSNANTDLRPVK